MFIAAWCAVRMTVSREHRLLEQGCGETRFPHAPARGRASPSRRGMGKPGFPIPPTRWEGSGGRSPPKKNLFIILFVCGGAAWMATVNIRPRRGVWGNPVSPCPHPREGVGGRSPPKKDVHPASVRRSRMDG